MRYKVVKMEKTKSLLIKYLQINSVKINIKTLCIHVFFFYLFKHFKYAFRNTTKISPHRQYFNIK